MKKHTKLLSLLLAMLMAFSVGMTGCSSKPSEPANAPSSSQTTASKDGKPDTSEAVTLTMYLLGDRTSDFDKVVEKINAKLKDKINATLNVKFLSWGEYEQKYPLVFASGENFDIIYSADWAFYNAQSTKQGFYEITKDALEKYAPITAETMYPEAWEQAKVNDKVYMLPMNYKELTAYVYMIRGDLMKKYNIADVKDINGIEAYLDAIAKNEKKMIPMDIGSDFDAQFMLERMWKQATYDKLDNVGPWQLMSVIDKNDSTCTVKSRIDDPKFLEVITHLKSWKDRGFWSKSAVVNTTDNRESFAAGKSASAIMNINDAKSKYCKIKADHPDWNIKVVDAQQNDPAIICSYLANGMSIFSKSKHPERALMTLDLLRNDEELHDLFSYGIEGVHFEKVGNSKIINLEASTNYGYDSNCNWGIRNDKYWRTIEGGIPNFDALYNNWVAKAKSEKYGTFNFNDANVKNEVAAINEIFKSDYKLLCLGFTENPQADIKKMQAKLKAAGADKVYAEMQKQAQEYLAKQVK